MRTKKSIPTLEKASSFYQGREEVSISMASRTPLYNPNGPPWKLQLAPFWSPTILRLVMRECKTIHGMYTIIISVLKFSSEKPMDKLCRSLSDSCSVWRQPRTIIDISAGEHENNDKDFKLFRASPGADEWLWSIHMAFVPFFLFQRARWAKHCTFASGYVTLPLYYLAQKSRSIEQKGGSAECLWYGTDITELVTTTFHTTYVLWDDGLCSSNAHTSGRGSPCAT